MARITLASFGKIKVPGLRETADHYLKLISKYSEVDELELKAAKLESRHSASRTQAQLEDQNTLLQKLSRDRQTYELWLLDETGKTLTTSEWSKRIQKFTEKPNVRIVLAIGSAQGWSTEFKLQANGLLSLGSQTLPHDLARVVLIEQLYRIFSLLAGHPYHIEG